MTADNVHHLEARDLTVTPEVGKPTLLTAANLAKEWFADMVREAERQTEDDIGAIRREIVFAACFMESYIFEWARDVAGMDKVVEHFRLKKDDYETVKDRWKEVPVRLHKKMPEKELIASESEFCIDWGDMGLVTKYRNGLVHGKASIPNGLKRAEDGPPPPEPTLRDLLQKGQGWALESVLKVVGQLHEQTGTPVPEYLEDHLDPL